MKIFNRVLATVLALIMTLAVLPLSALAASDPWVEVEAETNPLPEGNGTDTSIVVKLDAKALAEILKTTGISSALLNELKSHLVVDKDALMQILTPDELLEIISIEEILNLPSVDLGAILEELGDKITVYFDLEGMLGDLTEEQLDMLVNMDNALPVILDYYENQSEGLAGLLKKLLGDGTAADANNDGIPDDCAIRVEMLANATFFTPECFTEAIYDIEIEKYISESGAPGTIDMDHFLSHWPIDPNTGTYDLRFLEDSAGDLMINMNALLEKAEDENVHFTEFFALKRFLDENPALYAMVRDNYTAYLNATAQATVKAWASAAAHNKTDWEIDDFNKEALKVALGCANDYELMDKYQNENAVVTAKIAENPELYLTATTYAELRDSVLTTTNLNTLNMNDVNLAKIREDAHAIDASYHDHFFYSYVDLDGFVHANVDFVAHNITTVVTPAGLSAIHHNIDFIKIAQEIGLFHIIQIEGYQTSLTWLNYTNLIAAMEAAGVDLADYVNIAKAISAITPAKVASILLNSGVDILTLINVDQIVPVIGAKTLAAQLSPSEIVSILKLESVKGAIPEVVTLVLTKLPYIVDEITINNKVVAAEDPNNISGRLALDFRTLVKELAKCIPTLNDLKTLPDNKLFDVAFGVTYENANGDAVTKNISIALILEGDLDVVRNAATKLSTLLDRYIDFDIDANNVITLDIKVPAKATAIYAKVLATGKIPQSIKDKLLMLPEVTGNDAVAYFEDLTFEEIITVLENADVNALYEKFKQVSFVELVLEKIEAKTGRDLSALSLDDIVALIDTAVDKASANSIVNRIYGIIESKLGIDVTGVLDDVEVDALYDKLVEKASEFGPAFNKVKNYILLAIDKIAIYAPAALTTSIGDLYEGNGVFQGAGKFSVETNARAIVERALDLFMSKQSFITIPDKAVDFILDFVPADLSVSAGLDLTVRFANLYRVTYRDFDGTVLANLFLPKDTELSIYDDYQAPAGVEVDGWLLYGTDTVVTKVTGDMEVSPNPVIGVHNVFFLDESGNAVLTFKLLEGGALTSEQLAMIAQNVPVKNAAEGYEFVYRYDHNWYLDGTTPTTVFDPATIVMGTEDITVRSNYTKVYFNDLFTEDNVVPTEDGYTITVDQGWLETGVVLPEKIMEQAAAEDIDVTISDGNIAVTVDSDTINGFGTKYVAVKASEVDNFNQLYYTPDNASMYVLEVLIGDELTDLKCHKEVLGDDAEFDGDVTVTVAFDAIAATDKSATRVYTLATALMRSATTTRTLVDSTAVAGESVTFGLANCSDAIVVANEYKVTVAKTESNEPDDDTVLSGALDYAILYFPVGAEVSFDTLITETNGFTDYIVEDAYWQSATGATLYANVDDYGKVSFTMPEAYVDLTLEAGYKAIIDEVNKEYIVQIFTNGGVIPTELTQELPALAGEYAALGYKWVIRAVDKTSDPADPKMFELLVVGNETFKDLYATAAGEQVSFSYKKATSYTLGYYTNENSVVYDLAFMVGNNKYEKDFADLVNLQIPFADATAFGANDDYFTRVHFVDENGRVLVENVAFTNVADWGNIVAFAPEHFSYYAIANEYKVTYEFLYNNAAQAGGSLGGDLFAGVTTVYLPEGAVVEIKPVIDGYIVKVDGVFYENNNQEKIILPAYNGSAIRWKLTVPDEAVELKIDLKKKTYYINIYVNNSGNIDGAYTLYETIAYEKDEAGVADAFTAKTAAIRALIGTTINAPKYYQGGEFVGFDANLLNSTDMNVYLEWNPIEFTIKFQGMNGTVVPVTFTCESTLADVQNALSIPEVVGYVGSFDWSTLDLAASIDEMIAADTTEMTADLTYTARQYEIVSDSDMITVAGNAAFGSTVNFEIINKPYYTATVKIVTAKGDTVAVLEDGKSFVMPAEAVMITVTYTPEGGLMYTINGRPFDLYEISVAPNRVIETFDVYLVSGYEVVGMPDYCKLISTSVDEDGIIKLTYSFEVVRNNMAITYSIEKVEFDLLYIFNGAEYTEDGFPKISEKKVFFNGWSDRAADSIVFATFGVDTTTSYVWLWILIGLLVLIGLITLIYQLYINGKLKANFITRGVTWLVNGFFGVCIFVAAVGLYLFSLFGKKEEEFDYYADLGFDEEDVEEAVEEATEEAAEEATEEASEEVVEEATEEATEEVVEEATEEVAEEATKEKGEKPTNE